MLQIKHETCEKGHAGTLEVSTVKHQSVYKEITITLPAQIPDNPAKARRATAD